MKDDNFRAQFDKITAEMAESRRHRMLARVLGALRDSVQEMQDNGYPLTLEVRLRDDGCTRAPHMKPDEQKQVSANGTIRFGEGAPALEFIFQQQYAEGVYFKAYIGSQEVASHYAYGEDVVQLGQGMLRALMTVQAEHEMVGKFNLGDRNSKTAMIGKTVLPKPPKNA